MVQSKLNAKYIFKNSSILENKTYLSYDFDPDYFVLIKVRLFFMSLLCILTNASNWQCNVGLIYKPKTHFIELNKPFLPVIQ